MNIKQPPPDFHDMTRREIEDYIVELATIDDEFRDQLLRDPLSALGSAGLPIREGLSIRVVEQTDSAYTIVLPARPKPHSDLSDAELEQVAGGVGDRRDDLSTRHRWP